MATKRITVKNLLEITVEPQPVVINYFAYGVYYGDSTDSGTDAEELLKNLRRDCLNAEVYRINTSTDGTLYVTAYII
jgi:hypothetical protein